MRYSSEELGVAFELPDEPTVLQVLTFDSSLIEQRDQPAFVGLWQCVRPIISNWECEFLPDHNASLETLKGVQAARAIEFAANIAAQWRADLNEVPKN